MLIFQKATPTQPVVSLRLLHGDCKHLMRQLPPNSVHAIVTDPPYGLEFMGKNWDTLTHMQHWHQRWAMEAFKVLKPGGYLLSFGGTRTVHRLACAIEDAGFEIRDTLAWLYGTGFPKSLNLGDGWGTALKPAYEPIILARKPIQGTVAHNVSIYGTGGLHIDACRVEYHSPEDQASATPQGDCTAKSGALAGGTQHAGPRTSFARPELLGRWPANVLLDEEAAALLDEQTGDLGVSSGGRVTNISTTSTIYGGGKGLGQALSHEEVKGDPGYGDHGGPSRFFYVAKASRSERDAGCESLSEKSSVEAVGRDPDTAGALNPRAGAGRRGHAPIYRCSLCGLNLQGGRAVSPCSEGPEHVREVVGYNEPVKNHHPTVKPIAVMQWLVRLVTPMGGVVLDPFMGSGTTGLACQREGMSFIGMEISGDYLKIAEARLNTPHEAEPDDLNEVLHSSAG